MKLVVVESPNKKKSIQKYLGDGYTVEATVGHFRDLPKEELGVDLNTFDPTYVVTEGKEAVLSRLKAVAAKADEVILATDADREGEAIAWHIAEVLRLKKPKRVKFIEITAKALTAAVAAPGSIDQALVDAQQARRILDRIVGFQASPLLSPFGSGNSAGRVQSATLHLVCARELAREAFKVKPYWTLSSSYTNGLSAKYGSVSEEGKVEDTRFETEEEARAVEQRARGPHTVTGLEKKPAARKPKPPFTTSTLQQAASVALHLSPDATMSLAQSLFEKGAITYHRTDSTALSEDAIEMARAFIARDYPEALPSSPPRYAPKGDAQGAHEAIRPTTLDVVVPEDLTEEESSLYELIRLRFLCCQCKPAELETTIVSLTGPGATIWRARGSILRFPSFLKYLNKDEDETSDEEEPRLPQVAQGEVLDLKDIVVTKRETTPPPRFTKATLVKEMERVGIGRPSTYAATLEVLFEKRKYLAEEKSFVVPTQKGRLIDEALASAFADLVSADYTAKLEVVLDQISEGAKKWQPELRSWYAGFTSLIAAAPPKVAAVVTAHPELAATLPQAPRATDKQCPLCTKQLFQRSSKGRDFLSCSGYPACTFIADVSFKPHTSPCPVCAAPMIEQAGKYGPYARCTKKGCEGKKDLTEATGEPCPICSSPTKDRGDFLSCSKFPECKGSWDKKGLAEAKKANHTCSKCKRLLVPKKNQKGKFWGCSGYPACSHIESSLSEEPKRGRAPATRKK
ncbi:type I DNA topoisomerase (plasmid) [Myxococcus stipitatus]|uniref:type I DNA topoisomerase n=1 Tax=Myxococcus stipitatus TaxID=83455 RepID=UPI003144DB0B